MNNVANIILWTIAISFVIAFGALLMQYFIIVFPYVFGLAIFLLLWSYVFANKENTERNYASKINNVDRNENEVDENAILKIEGNKEVQSKRETSNSDTKQVNPPEIEENLDHYVDRRLDELKRKYEFQEVQINAFQINEEELDKQIEKDYGIPNHIYKNMVADGYKFLSKHIVRSNVTFEDYTLKKTHDRVELMRNNEIIKTYTM